MRAEPNLNALWASLLVEELARTGARRAFIAPGSRSAPLVRAVAGHPLIAGTIVLDERAAGYAALGWARARGAPAVVITTSGTAAANLLPAIVEASLERVPLLALTADRPPELRDAGANQTIAQTGLYGSFTRWAHDLPCPDPNVPARTVLTTVDHAISIATGSNPGPVHLNLPFREPLAPDVESWPEDVLEGLERWLGGEMPFTRVSRAVPAPASADVSAVLEARARGARGLVVVGGLPIGTDVEPIGALIERLGWPALADARSGLRGGSPPAGLLQALERVSGPEGVGPYVPEIVVQLGSRPISTNVLRLAAGGLASEWIVVDPALDRLDPAHRSSARHVAPPELWARAALEGLGGTPPATHATELAPLEHEIRSAIDSAIDAETALTEPHVARAVSARTPEGHGLFLSSSLPVRDADAFGLGAGPRLALASNRGASGIDGVVASAAGFTLGRDRPCTLLIGDLALIHDANALALVASERLPLTIVALNNGGGGIFRFLPIARHEDLVTPWFDTPHDVDLAHLAAAFGLEHVACEKPDAFDDVYARAIVRETPTIVEARSDLAENREVHRRIADAVRAVWPGTGRSS